MLQGEDRKVYNTFARPMQRNALQTSQYAKPLCYFFCFFSNTKIIKFSSFFINILICDDMENRDQYLIEELIPKIGVFLIKSPIHYDDRGYFMEGFNSSLSKEINAEFSFIQYNVSKSKYGTLRGLHFQKPPFSQAKFVRCLKGEIFDVAVDLRSNSPTYGKAVWAYLSEENNYALFIPRGFAHGFIVTSKEDAIVLYLVDNVYAPQAEGGINWADPSLNINWPLKPLLMSKKDTSWPTIEASKIRL
jgi:dTDP-4-dehydrorhamnose 3,5-epimerase